MKKRVLLVMTFVLATALVPMNDFALAQGQNVPAQDVPDKDSPPTGGAGARSGNITSTGETVPIPGASQSAGTTSLDRGIQQEDNKIQSSICKGC